MSNVYQEWIAAHNPDHKTKVLIDRWWEAEGVATESQDIQEAAGTWLTDRSLPEPDLFKSLALYGKSRLLTQDWTRLPIDVPESEQQSWRDSGLEPTLAEHREYQAAAIGGFLGQTGCDPRLFVDLIQRQLQQRLTRIQELLDKSLESYTPEDWNRLEAEGIEIDDGEFVELDRFDEPFIIYENLVCFEWALEKARIFTISQHSRELGLPNEELHKALMNIDLSDLVTRLQAIEAKLRPIHQHLVRYNYYRLNSEVAPERFWWRHSKRRR